MSRNNWEAMHICLDNATIVMRRRTATDVRMTAQEEGYGDSAHRRAETGRLRHRSGAASAEGQGSRGVVLGSSRSIAVLPQFDFGSEFVRCSRKTTALEILLQLSIFDVVS